MTIRLAAAAMLAVAAGMAEAQQFAGAEISAEVLGFADDIDLGETKYAGGAELNLFGQVGVGANLAFHGSRAVDLDARNFTLHGVYGLGGETTLGAFYGSDGLEDDDVAIYGVEGATQLRGLNVEGALGRYDGDSASGALLSLEAAYGFGSVTATGYAGFLTGDLEASRIAVGGEYQLSAGPSLYAEVGRLGVEDENETYLSIGARLAIGPNRGTTFGNRGVLEIAPGLQSGLPDEAADPLSPALEF